MPPSNPAIRRSYGFVVRLEVPGSADAEDGAWTDIEGGGLEITPGGTPYPPYYTSGRTYRVLDVVLRGPVGSSPARTALLAWFAEAARGAALARDLVVAERARDGSEARRFRFTKGVPVRWTLPAWDAGARVEAIEEVVLRFQSVRPE